jgi:DNA polymerase III delta prime subunit
MNVIPWITYFDAITEVPRIDMRRAATVLYLARAITDGSRRPTDELLS